MCETGLTASNDTDKTGQMLHEYNLATECHQVISLLRTTNEIEQTTSYKSFQKRMFQKTYLSQNIPHS